MCVTKTKVRFGTVAIAMTKTSQSQRVSQMGAYAPSYDGTSARVLEGAQVGRTRARERAKARTQEKVITRPQVEVREAGAVSPFAVLGFLAVGVVAFFLVLSCAQLTAVSDEVITLENQLASLKTEEVTLLTQYELAYDLRGTEFMLTDDSTMAEPRADQIIYVDLSSPDTVTYFVEADAQGVEGVVDGILDMGGQVVEYFR